jgi:hypothetical protein
MSPVATHNTPTTSAKEPLKVICDILQSEMGLTAKQIATAYQDYKIPADGLFVVAGYLGPTEIIASQGYLDTATNEEVQEVVVRHMIQIDLMSMAPDNSARIRKEEIALALRSFYSLKEQDLNNIGIAWLLSDFIDASAPEGTTMLNRYVTTCAVTALHRKVKTAGYLDGFAIDLNVAAPPALIQIDPATAPFNP